jgi:hypothetical protein
MEEQMKAAMEQAQGMGSAEEMQAQQAQVGREMGVVLHTLALADCCAEGSLIASRSHRSFITHAGCAAYSGMR